MKTEIIVVNSVTHSVPFSFKLIALRIGPGDKHSSDWSKVKNVLDGAGDSRREKLNKYFIQQNQIELNNFPKTTKYNRKT
jgi:hypothetical protein